MNYKQLQAEIHKRDYENIEGLKAEITEQEFNYFLEVLPPLNWLENSYLLSECLSENLYLKFSRLNNKFFCEVVRYDLNEQEIEVFG